MSRRIVIEFLGKDTSLSKTTADVQSKTSKLSAGMQKAGAVAGKALVGGAVLAAGGLYKMGQAAAEDEAAQDKLAAALRQAAGASDEQIASTEDWISAMGKQLGVADDELRPALSRLADATGSVSKAQKLTALAMDVSAGTGKDLNTVTEALIKAQNGSIGGLSRLGVATKDAEGKTKSLKEVTGDLTDLYAGRAAQAAETTAGKQKILQVQLGELGEQIGAKVLPVMVRLSEIGLQMVNWVSRNTTTVGILVGVLAGLAATVWTVGAAIKAWTAITKVWQAVTKVAVAVQWAMNAAMTANPIGLVVVAIAALVAGLIIAYKKSETFRRIVNGAFGAVKKVAVAAFDKVVGAAKFVWGWIKKNWPMLLAIITGPFGLAVGLIAKNWGKIKDGAAAVKNWVIGKFADLISYFRKIPSRISSVASGMFNGVRDAFRAAINWIIGAWNDLNFSIPGFDWPGPGSFAGVSIGTPNIPLMDKGGVVRGPGVVRVGPIDEAMVPLTGRHARSLGGTNVYITVQSFDPRESGRLVEQALIKWQRTTGQRLGIKTS